MPKRTIANSDIDVNEEGFMTDSSQWTEDIAEVLAKEEGIESLTEGHWKVIRFLRSDSSETGSTPTIRRIQKVGGIPTKELYQLFPGGPLKKASKIAGLTKPQSCV